MIAESAKAQKTAADQVTVAISSMGESVRAPLPVGQCRKSWKNARARDFGQKSSLLRCARQERLCRPAVEGNPMCIAGCDELLNGVCFDFALEQRGTGLERTDDRTGEFC